MPKYTYSVSYSYEDKCFIARVEEFKFLMAHGDTYQEALNELRFVLEDLGHKLDE